MADWPTLATEVLGALGVVVALVSAFSLLLWRLNRALPQSGGQQLLEDIMTTLPQTQCAQCGYAGCRPYAEALLQGEAIDKCPPGGEHTRQQLAALLNRATSAATLAEPAPLLAKIRETDCIGCALCLPACPVDAIIGAPRFLHRVVDEQCTGCGLCLPPCPVDCIELKPATANPWTHGA